MDTAKPGYKWLVAVLLFFTAGLNYADRTAITAVFPLLRADLGMSDLELGATGTVFLWTYALVSPFAGFLGDRFSRARLLTWSLCAWSLVMALTALAATTGQLLAMRALLGVAEAAYIPAATALLADHHSAATRARAIGIHLAGFSAGMVGGGALAGYLGEHYGWRPSLVLLGGVGLVLSVVSLLFLRDAPQAGTNPARTPLWQSLAYLIRIPTFLVLTAEIVLSGTVNWVLINWLPLFFRETFALSLAMAGLYGALWIQSGRVAGFGLGGIPSDRVARIHPRFRMLTMAGCYFIAAPLLLMFLAAPSFLQIAAAIFGFALMVGMGYVNAQPLLCEIVPSQLRSTAVGFMNMSSCLVGGAGVLIAGGLKSSFGLQQSFAALSAIQGGVALMLVFAFWKFVERDLHRAGEALPQASVSLSPASR